MSHVYVDKQDYDDFREMNTDGSTLCKLPLYALWEVDELELDEREKFVKVKIELVEGEDEEYDCPIHGKLGGKDECPLC